MSPLEELKRDLCATIRAENRDFIPSANMAARYKAQLAAIEQLEREAAAFRMVCEKQIHVFMENGKWCAEQRAGKFSLWYIAKGHDTAVEAAMAGVALLKSPKAGGVS